MVSETVELVRSVNGKAKAIGQNGADRVADEELNGRHRNLEVASVCSRSDGKKKSNHRRELTMEDICNNLDDLEDDEDDLDWEPFLECLTFGRWSCTNCTMLNPDSIIFCETCKEHKESGILKHGFFGSPASQGAALTPVELEVIERYTESVPDVAAARCSTAIGFDERMLLHSEVEKKMYSHPERPDRLRAIAASLSTAGIFPGKCRPITAREITKEELLKVHSMEHVEAVELTEKMLSSYFTPDTYANEHSAEAARLAAGLCADLATEIYSGCAKNGFALIRPPGHHAGVHESMGFCLHNNAAVAALAAQVAGAKKVLIVDWDVHHGNGTQEIFDKNKSVLYISLHRHEGGNFYPGTGAAHEVGTMGAEGYCVNVPWSCGGVGDNDYIFAFEHVVLPIAQEFVPDFIIISAGFDAARGDPLGGCDVTPAGYACMTNMLNTLAGGKTLVILEGGYNLRSISSSATAVIKVLLGESPENQFSGVAPSAACMQAVLDVLKIQTNFWSSLNSNFMKLQSCWESYLVEKRRKKMKKRKLKVAEPPIFWKWGRKRFLYYLHLQRFRVKP
ncbi:histone deacetylase 15 [Spinacia oleracea]|uniref:histone deacetylase n=1 Tax=Spinacia oleracea TaxID=3562 RepID=A0A9R0JWQ4_SPIOL|nr:histone deacetylase 15 [Spinacia oleracea]XP_021849864.2 histone deacetylase 15 [Spinacia oleracea]